jgi:hypothetical protein
VKHLAKSIPNQVLAFMKSYFPKAPVDVVAGGLAANCNDEQYAECCGDSRSYRAQAMRENLSSRTKTKTQDKGQPKALYSIVAFSKVDPLYKCRSVSLYREAGGLLHFREHPRVKRIKTECARLSSGNLQSGLHVIGAS